MPKKTQFRRPDPRDTKRKVAVEATVGSDVYDLKTEASDLDWVHYVYPTFDDLYDRAQVSYEYTDEAGDDHKCRDVRHLAHLVKKANLNTLEMLYSPRLAVDTTLGWLVEERDTLARLDLPRLYDSTVGTFRQHADKLAKSAGAHPHAYDTKAYTHLHRLVCLVETYAACDFETLRTAVRHPEGSDTHDQLMALHRGVHTTDEALDMVPVLEARLAGVRDAYYAKKPGAAEDAALRLMEDRLKRSVFAHLRQTLG